MKPFHIRLRSWKLVLGLSALALTLGPGQPPRNPADAPLLAQVSEPTNSAAVPPAAPAHRVKLGAQPQARASRAAKRERVKSDRLAHPPASTALAGTGGRIVALDPETGQLGAPSPEQLRALRAASGIASMGRTEEGLAETRLTDGTVILDLGGRFQENVLARLDGNGRLTYRCVHDDARHRAARDTASTTLLETE